MPLGKLPFRREWNSRPAFREALGQIAESGKLPDLPPAQTWKRTIGDQQWLMLGNKVNGDCTVAAACHMMMCWSDNTRIAPWIFEEADVLADYNEYRTSASGAQIQNILNAWKMYGLHRRDGDVKVPVLIDDFALLDINHPSVLQVQVQRCVQLLGGCCIGLILPKFATAAAPKTDALPPPPDWTQSAATLDALGTDADKDSGGGHCVPAIGYDAQGLQVITWGQCVPMSWDFFSRYMDEAWAVLCKTAWVVDGKTPSGLTDQQLVSDFGVIDA
jgi:hypothetical protein